MGLIQLLYMHKAAKDRLLKLRPLISEGRCTEAAQVERLLEAKALQELGCYLFFDLSTLINLSETSLSRMIPFSIIYSHTS